MLGRFPRRFGKYVLLKPLAKGGMGEIYMAATGDIGGFEKLCVIKKVISEKADRAKAARFLDEAKVVLRLSHAALVNTFDAGEVDGQFYIAMELVEGKDLREVWNRCVRTRQRIPLDVALFVVREVARALAYVHGYGDLKLVHRDVAPPNILLAYVGDVKLTDFGLARSVLKQEHTAPGVVFGRAAYLAPEQARGEVADARTDVYTLGIVLWELLTGQQYLQLGGLDPAAALAIVRSPSPVAPSMRAPWIVPALDKVVMKALATSRDERFASADDMRQALSEVMAEVAPRADAARVAEFLRLIYAETIEEETAERERYLKEEIPKFRAAPPREESPEPAPVPTAVPQPEMSGSLPGATRPRPRGGAPRLPGVAPEARPAASSSIIQGGAAALAVPGLRRSTPGRGAEIADPGGVLAARTQAKNVGRVVAGYELTEALGPVGLFRGRARDGGREALLHLLPAGAPSDDQALERWRELGRRLAGLGRPELLGLDDAVRTDDGQVVLVRPALGSGRDLPALVSAERRLDPSRAADLLAQTCRAIGAAHEAGLFHGALRPDSLFVQRNEPEAVRVVDFGLGLMAPVQAANGKTPLPAAAFMSPERLAGAPADAASDVYALGAILHELVTGAPPRIIATHNGGASVAERPQSPRMFRPDLPDEIEAAVMAALEADPAARFASTAALERALAPLLDRGSPSTSASDGERRRNRRMAALRAVGELAAEPKALPALIPTPAPVPTVSPATIREIPTAPPPASTAADTTPDQDVLPPSSAIELPPSAPKTPRPAFGGAVLARYGASNSSGRGALLRNGAIALVLLALGAFALTRSCDERTAPPAASQPR